MHISIVTALATISGGSKRVSGPMAPESDIRQSDLQSSDAKRLRPYARGNRFCKAGVSFPKPWKRIRHGPFVSCVLTKLQHVCESSYTSTSGGVVLPF